MTLKIAGFLIPTGIAVLLASCGQVPNQFFIVQNQVPEPGCVIPVDSSIHKSEGTLDVSLVRPGAVEAYFAFPLLQNDLPAAPEGAQQNRVALSHFTVDVEAIGTLPANTTQMLAGLEANDPSVLHFTHKTTGSVFPGGGLTASHVAVISANLARRVRDTGDLKSVPYLQLGARIRAVGDRGTGSIESDAFLYPIKVCEGCLIARLESCPFTTEPTNTGNECNVAQDTAVDCCTSANSLICPPPVEAP